MSYTLEEALSCVGPGWHEMIKFLYKHAPPGLEVLQVKEKYGVLRFYHVSTSDNFTNVAEMLENLSTNICENCGKWKPSIIVKDHWYHSLCEECLKHTRDGKLWYGGI